MLPSHVTASAEVLLHEAISAGRIGIRGAPWGSGPVPRLRGQLAALLVTSDVRPGLFADPVPLHRPACPGDEPVAFLGRRPFRGDSEGSAWSA